LIFDRDLPEEESIQTADQYLENFKVLYCKIKKCERALNALPETERETWTAAKCVSDKSHIIALLEGIRDLKYQSKVFNLEEAKKVLHVIIKEVINLHIAESECIKMNENVVWGVADLELDFANVFKTRVAFNAKGPSGRLSSFKTPGKPVKAGVTFKGRESVLSKNEHPNSKAENTTAMSSGTISKSHKRIASTHNHVSMRTVQKPPRGKF
jgi:hypothetical protein